MKAVVAAFNQEKALVGAFSVITNLRMLLFEVLGDLDEQEQDGLLVPLVVLDPLHHRVDVGVPEPHRLPVVPLLQHAPDLPGPGLVRGIGQPGERAVEDCLEADLQYNITLHYITLHLIQ